MNDIRTRSVADVAEALQHAKREGRGATLFLGAGCSVTAGIPAAAGIIERVRRDFPRAAGRALREDYPSMMAELASGERADLIAWLVSEARINVAHLALGWLVYHGYIARVLTTNFDNLALRGCAMFNTYPAVYDVAATHGAFVSGLVRTPAILHLHGQSVGFVQLHTTAETSLNAAKLRLLLEEANQGRPWAVVGYSGNNDPVFEALREIRDFKHSLFWVPYRDADPGRQVTAFLRDVDDTFLVPGYSADTFFLELLRELRLPAPDIVIDPLARLERMLDQIGPLTAEDQHAAGEIQLGSSRSVVARARMHLEEDQRRSRLSGSIDASKLEAAFFDGQYEQVLGGLPARPPADVDEKLRANIARGLNNWGAALGRQTVADGQSTARVLRDAIAKFEQSHAWDSSDATALHNWGLALARMAALTNEADAVLYYGDAAQRLQQAVDASERPPREWLSSLGAALRELAIRTPDRAARRALLYRAVAAYEQAIEARGPEVGAEEVNLAGAFGDLATVTEDAESRNILDHARQIMEKVRASGYANGVAHNNWALLHLHLARGSSEVERLRLLSIADAASRLATETEPETAEFHENRAVILAEIARTDPNCSNAAFKGAEESFEVAARIAPGRARVLKWWAGELLARSDELHGPERRLCLVKARELSERARRLQPNEAIHSVHLAEALVDLSTIDSADARSLLTDAESVLSGVLAREPHNWPARIAMLRTLAADDPTRTQRETRVRRERALAMLDDFSAEEPDVVSHRTVLGGLLVQMASEPPLSDDRDALRPWLARARRVLEALGSSSNSSVVDAFFGMLAMREADVSSDQDVAIGCLVDASAHFASRLQTAPSDVAALVNAAVAEMRLASLQKDESRIATARQYLGRVLAFDAEHAVALMNMACAAALEGDAETALNWLRRRRLASPPLTRDAIERDSDFDSVRQRPAFEAFVSSLPRAQE